jgi:Fe2+ or Zn2+ uptake regulation protein
MSTYSNQELIELLERAASEQDARLNANTRGHVWIKNSRGHVDVDGSSDFHNHVQCEKCGYVYCIACHHVPQKDCTK